MIKKILLIVLLSLSSLMAKEDIIKLKERSYIITNKNKLFTFNGISDKFVEFKIDKNIIFNKNFNTGFTLEDNKLKIYQSYNIFTNEYSKKFEEWNLSKLEKNQLLKSECYKLFNKKYELTLCEN